jgi:hypothetical protein
VRPDGLAYAACARTRCTDGEMRCGAATTRYYWSHNVYWHALRRCTYAGARSTLRQLTRRGSANAPSLRLSHFALDDPRATAERHVDRQRKPTIHIELTSLAAMSMSSTALMPMSRAPHSPAVIVHPPPRHRVPRALAAAPSKISTSSANMTPILLGRKRPYHSSPLASTTFTRCAAAPRARANARAAAARL